MVPAVAVVVQVTPVASVTRHRTNVSARSRRARGDHKPMRRLSRASAGRLLGRFGAASIAVAVMAASAFGHCTGTASAEPASPEGIATLVAAVANANQKLQDLGAAIQTQQESVNKAIVDVQTARDAAAAAQHEVDAGQAGLDDANAAIAAAQQRFDEFA